jgi:hypothetical protein
VYRAQAIDTYNSAAASSVKLSSKSFIRCIFQNGKAVSAMDATTLLALPSCRAQLMTN